MTRRATAETKARASGRRLAETAAAAVFWLAAWQVASLIVGNGVLLAGPFDTVAALAQLIPMPAFWSKVWFSTARIVGGVGAGYAIALALAAASFRWVPVRALVSPALSAIKSTPVACIVVLLLIWIGSRNVSAMAVLLLVVPGIYFPVLEGLGRLDRRYEELFGVMGADRAAQLFARIWPGLLPYLVAASQTVLGMSWKAGVAAELIGTPLGSIGERIYQTKLLLDSASLFAWTIVVIALAWTFERLVLGALRASWPVAGRLFIHRIRKGGRSVQIWNNRTPHMARREREGRESAETNALIPDYAPEHTPDAAHDPSAEPPSLPLQGHANPYLNSAANKRDRRENSGASHVILAAHGLVTGHEDTHTYGPVDLTLRPGEALCLTGASGAGKTTLLMTLSGLLPPITGTVDAPRPQAVVFQDTRLIEDLTAAENIRLFAAHGISPSAVIAVLQELLLPTDAADTPVRQLSGGQRRRVEIARALVAPGSLVLLDEPFTGLDDRAHEHAAACIRAHLAGRALVLSTHDAADAARLDARVLHLG